MFAAAADHKTSYIVQKDKGNFLLVTVHNEPRGFIGTIVINDPTHLQFSLFVFYHQPLICHNAHGPSLYPGITTKDRFAMMFLKLLKFTIVNDSFNHLNHVVRLTATHGENVIYLFRIL